MCIYTESIDGVLHGTETLEQNDVPLHTRAERTDCVFCRGGGCHFCFCNILQNEFQTLIDKQQERR